MSLWRLQRVIRLALLGIPFVAVAAVALAAPAGRWVAVAFVGVAVAAQLVVAVLWPALAWRAFSYTVREHDLLVQRGVLFRRWSSIPFTRIQHVDTRQGPMERMLGLSRLMVFTAAGMSADGVILTKEGRRALYLPQVAVEQGWDLVETLRHLAAKAGLAPDDWKGAELQTFQGYVYSEARL